MGVIFVPKHLIWQRLKCAHIIFLILHFHTGNLYCGAVPIFHASIFLSNPNYGVLKDARGEDDNLIISDSTLCSLLPPQLNKLLHNTSSFVVGNVEFLLKVYIHNCYPVVIGI